MSHLLKLKFNSTFSFLYYSLYLPIVVQATTLRWAFFCFCDGWAACIVIFNSWWICDGLQLIYFGGWCIWVFLNKIWAGCAFVCVFGCWLSMMWPFGVVLLAYVSRRMLFALCCTTVLYTQPLDLYLKLKHRPNFLEFLKCIIFSCYSKSVIKNTL